MPDFWTFGIGEGIVSVDSVTAFKWKLENLGYYLFLAITEFFLNLDYTPADKTLAILCHV